MADFMMTPTEGGISDAQLDEDFDLSLSLFLQEEEMALKQVQAEVNSVPDKPLSVISPEWETLDPNPDIHKLFIQFNCDFFWGALGSVEVHWSSRMTLCAGLCSYEYKGGYCSIGLSQPLLKFRPRSDLVETLLHEMIHAYLFVTQNNRDHDAHGPEFLKHMNRINQQTGAKISVYHNFHDEVDYQRQHWWKCDGPCQSKKPYFGIVKRAMNRAPSPKDPWWAFHQSSCGGKFTKIREPENYGRKNQSKKVTFKIPETMNNPASKDIRTFFPSPSGKGIQNTKEQIGQAISTAVSGSRVSGLDSPQHTKSFTPFAGKGHVLGHGVCINSPTGNRQAVNVRIPSKLLGSPWGSERAQHMSFGMGISNMPSTSAGKPVSSLLQGRAPSRNNSSQSPHMNARSDMATKQKQLDSFFQSPKSTRLADGKGAPWKRSPVFFSGSNDDHNKPFKKFHSVVVSGSDSAGTVPCPVCSKPVKTLEMNDHLDSCLKR